MEHVTDDCQCEGKYCIQCTQSLCIERFARNKAAKDGRQSYCRSCDAAKGKAWRENNREWHRLRMAQYLQKGDNREKHNAQTRKYIKNNREKASNASKNWRQNNPERVRSYRKDWILTEHCKNVRQEVSKRWRLNNPERKAMYDVIRRTRKTQAGGSFTFEEWQNLKSAYDHSCLCCGKQEPEIKLTPDHIIPVSKQGTSNIENIQPLCRSCNSRKQDKIIDYRAIFKNGQNS